MKLRNLLSVLLTVILIFCFSVNSYAAGLKIDEYGNEQVINDTVEAEAKQNDFNTVSSSKNLISLFSVWVADESDFTEYYYDQLEYAEKCIYDSINENLDNIIGGTNPVSIDCSGTTILLSQLNNGDFDWSKPFFTYFNFDHPEIFGVNFVYLQADINGYYINNGADAVITAFIVYFGGTDKNNTLLGYDSKEAIYDDMDTMEIVVNNIIDTIPQYASRNKKIDIINSWLVDNNTYNPYIAAGDNDSASDIAWMTSSALLYNNGTDETKYPVCEGYAEAFKYLCDRANIPCVCVVSADHKWNLVQMEDGNWYQIDPTWNDPIGTQTATMRYNYYLKGSENSKFNNTSHIISMTNPALTYPEICTSDYDYNYAYNGDVNQDNLIEYQDAVLMLKHISGKSTISDEFIGSADLNQDGVINFTDVIKVMEFIKSEE